MQMKTKIYYSRTEAKKRLNIFANGGKKNLTSHRPRFEAPPGIRSTPEFTVTVQLLLSEP